MGSEIGIDIASRLTGATTDIATKVTGAIRDAARVTGAGFDYLLNTAIRESNLNPDAKAKSSSATGLFQFIDQTWLGTMKQSGTSLGYGKYSDAISQTASGKYVVNNPQMRDQIFALRKEPNANALMAGAFANANAKVLSDRLGRKPTDGELYMAHFLGAAGASRFIKAAEANPNGTAANLFPRAAATNKSIFYDKSGAARSLKQVYAGLISKHNVIGTASPQVADAQSAAPVQSAAATKSIEAVKPVAATRPSDGIAAMWRAPVPASPSQANDPGSTKTTSVSSLEPKSVRTVSFMRPQPVAATVTTRAVAQTSASDAIAAAAPITVADNTRTEAPASFADRVSAFTDLTTDSKRASGGPIFQSLYQTDNRGPVAPVVSELWGARAAAPTESANPITAPSDVSSQRATRPALNAPLDLLQFRRPAARG